MSEYTLSYYQARILAAAKTEADRPFGRIGFDPATLRELWRCIELERSGYLNRSRWGFWTITKAGRQALKYYFAAPVEYVTAPDLTVTIRVYGDNEDE